MDHYKIYCQEHAYEQIINFCTDRNNNSTQLTVLLHYVPPASAIILESICKEELLPGTKTSKIHTPAITK